MVGGWSAPDEQPAALRRVPGPWVMKSVHDFAPPPQGRVDKMTPSQRGGSHGFAGNLLAVFAPTPPAARSSR